MIEQIVPEQIPKESSIGDLVAQAIIEKGESPTFIIGQNTVKLPETPDSKSELNNYIVGIKLWEADPGNPTYSQFGLELMMMQIMKTVMNNDPEIGVILTPARLVSRDGQDKAGSIIIGTVREGGNMAPVQILAVNPEHSYAYSHGINTTLHAPVVSIFGAQLFNNVPQILSNFHDHVSPEYYTKAWGDTLRGRIKRDIRTRNRLGMPA